MYLIWNDIPKNIFLETGYRVLIGGAACCAPVEMQAAEAPPGLEPAIEWLPGEVVARVFCFVDAKTLIMTIPTVSG